MGNRGKLNTTPNRLQYLNKLDELINTGIKQKEAIKLLDISERTIQRWRKEEGLIDKRQVVKKKSVAHRLSYDERAEIIRICNLPKYADLPPSQIVPILADEGIYIASESSFYRVLKEHDMLNRRGRTKAKTKKRFPASHVLNGPNQLWSWDITYCPTKVKGQFNYLYMIMDVYSRKIVGWEVYDAESAKNACELVEKTVIKEKIAHKPLILHSDNGAPMKAFMFHAKLEDLGILSSRSRPGVSNDNAYSESLFKTMKYFKNWPKKGFDNIKICREWIYKFINYYNNDHKHSKINYVSPNQRHNLADKLILEKRDKLYENMKKKNPRRWSRNVRNWNFNGIVKFNTQKENEGFNGAA